MKKYAETLSSILKTGYKLELLSKETMRFPGSTEQVVAKDKDGKNMPKLEMTDVKRAVPKSHKPIRQHT